MSGQMETVYHYIKDKILEGTYKPSQRLTEIELSQSIGASRNTIKKALLKLEQENLVEIEKNKGAFIKSFTLEEITNYLQIREVLEGLVSKTAARYITEEQLRELERLLNEMEGHLQNHRFDEYSNLNKQFHQIIYNASMNMQAVQIITTIKTQLLRYDLRTILIPGRNHNSFQEHKKILNALKAHDAKLAEEAIMAHIANVRETVERNFTILM